MFRLALVVVGVSAVTADSPREVVNFDFGWRHMLGSGGTPSPPGPPRSCNESSIVQGANWGTGGKMSVVSNASECCAACAQDSNCGCWDFDAGTGKCYTKTECSTQVKADRTTGKFPTPPPPPPPNPNPPESQPGFDDSAWQQVNAPHDMLIAQPYDPSNSEKMAFIARNVGWYRKHFSVPTEWKGQSISIYFEGIFHETTVWLNGKQVAFHDAGYTSWWLRIDTEDLQYGGENVLSAFVNASTGTGWWFEGGGLLRHMQLVATDPVHIQPFGSWVHTNGTTFITETVVENDGTSSFSGKITATLSDARTGETCTTNSAQVTAAAGQASSPVVVPLECAGAKKWSVQSPNLYIAKVVVTDGSGSVKDAINITTGARDIRWDADHGLFVNDEHVKMRGFCDHSNFGGVGGAIPDRVQLYRAQALRSVGGNAWRMAHNPPFLSRLDYMDALGMVALDENRDYGGHRGQGGVTDETVEDELNDMAALVKRDRSHPSVIFWSFCNEVGCNNESSAQAFREVSKLWDPTRAVTQNHHGSDLSTNYLDVQGFSHRRSSDFTSFHQSHPTKPMAATECCSCMSQRGIDQDFCPKPADGGCGGCKTPGTCPVFYNNNIGECTSSQVIQSDEPDYLAGTFVWSGFDYLGEARGWPQNTKCRGTVADVAGFTKETAYWLKSWWQANISQTDAGRPLGAPPGYTGADSACTVFILESWVPPPSGSSNRTINVYTNAPAVTLSLNGKPAGEQSVPFFGMATFSVPYAPGTLTATAMGSSGSSPCTYNISTPSEPAQVLLTLDAPSAAFGTGSALVADGEDTAMLRANIVDSAGRTVPGASHNVTFEIVSGQGLVWATHNGDPANDSPSLAPWTPAYHGLARAFVRSTADHATSPLHRRRLRQIDLDSNVQVATSNTAVTDIDPIVVKVTVEGGLTAQVSIPMSGSVDDLPMAVALRHMSQ